MDPRITALPWKYQEMSDAYTHIVRGPHGEFIAAGPQSSLRDVERDMRHIVRAVNSHAALVAALKACMVVLQSELDCRDRSFLPEPTADEQMLLEEIQTPLRIARTALELASDPA